MREGFDHKRGIPHSMVYPLNHPNYLVRGKQKGLEAVLRERKLWPLNNRRSDGMKFRLQCPTSNRLPGCTGVEETELEGRCCARALMAAQKDFREQKGRLEEELNVVNHLTILYPKFHCELNFIERFWCSVKRYACEHCSYTFEGLRTTVPASLDSVSPAEINRHYNHCMRILDAYSAGHTYGTEVFRQRVYKAHRQVVDKTKW